MQGFLNSEQRAVFSRVNEWAYGLHRPLIEVFHRELGFWPDVACPVLYTEKLLWRKIFDRNPLFSRLCDKLQAREWMAERWPGLSIARTLWSGARAADIPPEIFGGDVVFKTNHGSGFNLSLPAASAHREAIARKLDEWLATDFWKIHYEWGYRDIARKIFVEEKLPNPPDEPLLDFNFHCCDGQVVFYGLTIGEKTAQEAVANFLADGTRDWEIDRTPNYDKLRFPPDYRLPRQTEEALAAAMVLSRGFDFARVDIMLAGGKLYAGEMTFYPAGGHGKYTKFEVARQIGLAWDIRKSWFMTAPQPGDSATYVRVLKSWLGQPQTAPPGAAG